MNPVKPTGNTVPNPMETSRRKHSSGDKFSFPRTIPIQTHDSDQFEFGCTTPGSPNSPADHLFFNGRILPQPFPLQPPTSLNSYTRSTSRTSSVSSKDSLMSSRCNSTSSRSSSSTTTSARTSVSTETSERKLVVPSNQAKFGGNMGVKGEKLGKKQVYGGGSSRKWGLISPAPVLSHQVSRRRKGGEIVVKKKVEVNRGGRVGFGRRLLMWFVTACKECHAIKPSRRDDVNMELQ